MKLGPISHIESISNFYELTYKITYLRSKRSKQVWRILTAYLLFKIIVHMPELISFGKPFKKQTANDARKEIQFNDCEAAPAESSGTPLNRWPPVARWLVLVGDALKKIITYKYLRAYFYSTVCTTLRNPTI